MFPAFFVLRRLGKRFFFEKKKQKTFIHACGRGTNLQVKTPFLPCAAGIQSPLHHLARYKGLMASPRSGANTRAPQLKAVDPNRANGQKFLGLT
jgi:hypothetical protein